MKKNQSNSTPHEDWSLDQLGRFAQQIAKRTAHNAWLLGRAYTIAKARAKAEGKKIESWRSEWVPFLSQPTLSRYEAVAKLPEDDVKDKGLTDVYRLLGLAPQQTNRTEADAPTNLPPAGESPNNAGAASIAEPQTLSASEGVPHRTTPLKVLSSEPESEPDSLLKRLAPVVALLHSILRDLPSLDTTLDATPAIKDAALLLEQLRAGLVNNVAA
jgi:hypothetical protein